MKAEITIYEGDKLWPLVSAIRDSHYDDMTPERLEELRQKVIGWRVTMADGSSVAATQK